MKNYVRNAFVAPLVALVLVACGGGSGEEASEPYGSIALNDETFYAATSTYAPSQEKADLEAINACGGDGCAVVLRFSGSGTCGALVVGSNLVWGVGTGPTVSDAERGARLQCIKQYGSDCFVSENFPIQCMN